LDCFPIDCGILGCDASESVIEEQAVNETSLTDEELEALHGFLGVWLQ
jgi:hypothetical protein